MTTTTAIVTADDTIRYSENGLIIPPDTTYEQWYDYGKHLGRAYSAIQWAVGDWINWGESHFGEKYAQALDDLTFAYGTLRNYASVCARIPQENRDKRLRFHQIKHVACLEPEAQARVIAVAIQHKMTGDDVLEAVQRIMGKKAAPVSISGRVVSCEGRKVIIESDEMLYYQVGQEVKVKG